MRDSFNQGDPLKPHTIAAPDLFLSALDTLSEAVWIIDHTTNQHHWFASERNKIKFGVPQGDIPKTFWLDNIHPDDWDYAVHGYQRALEDPSISCYGHEYRFKGPCGEYMVIHDLIKFLRNSDGCVLHSIGTWRDITLERRLEEMNRKLIRKDKTNEVLIQSIETFKLAIPTFDGFIFTYIKNICYCKASGNYTEITMVDGTIHVVSRTLKNYEDALGAHGFFRIHHSFLINLGHVKKYVRGDGGYVMMDDNKVIDVSKRKKEAFLVRLEGQFVSAA
jgi:hypothetical protein